ncbi:unnamed protein product [Amoebophrya sp. A120]|nr:unnamed protein product [Amoebophrya sp. A120]|eukprot:GSA120T00017336001.1
MMGYNRAGEVDMGSGFLGSGGLDDMESAEVEAVRAACDALPIETGSKLKAMFSSNGLTMADLDVKSVMELARLHITLQAKVLQHMENERVFLCNSRSKSRFLISTCERAKQGALDVRGFGAIDPWKSHLNNIAVCNTKDVDLVEEEEYLVKLDKELNCGLNAIVSLEVHVSKAVCPMLAEISPVELTFTMASTLDELKEKFLAMGCTVKLNHMKLRLATDNHVNANLQPANWNYLGFLRGDRTFAYYNFPAAGSTKSAGVKLSLLTRARGGVRLRKDLSRSNRQPDTRPSLLEQTAVMTAMLQNNPTGHGAPEGAIIRDPNAVVHNSIGTAAPGLPQAGALGPMMVAGMQRMMTQWQTYLANTAAAKQEKLEIAERVEANKKAAADAEAAAEAAQGTGAAAPDPLARNQPAPPAPPAE